MKVYAVIPFCQSEGCDEPIGIYSTLELAKEELKKQECAFNVYEEYFIFSYEIDDGKGVQE